MSAYQDGLFGIPTSLENAKIVIIPVPWEVTTSYGGGTARGPEKVLLASEQVDLFDRELGAAHEAGYHMLPIPEDWLSLNDRLKPKALAVREGPLPPSTLKEINAACEKLNQWVHDEAQKILARGQIPAVLGGDHSSPLGLIQAVSESVRGQFGVLHFDAHADLRDAYQGFKNSHASIMFNVTAASWRPAKLVQVGIRDFCQEEFDLIESRKDIETYFDMDLKNQMLEGAKWSDLARKMVEKLPEYVYVSFDVDGLSPDHCPNTGTPVPGGLSFAEANYVLKTVVESGRRIIGFDLNEVSYDPETESDWDANVGARILYKLCGWTVKSSRA